MFKTLRRKRGQSYIVEYALTFFVVIAVILSITLFVRRAVQARIRDARNFMVLSANGAYVGNVAFEYEPYYLDTSSNRFATTDDERLLEPSGPSLTSGIFTLDKKGDETTIRAVSNQAPPREATNSLVNPTFQ